MKKVFAQSPPINLTPEEAKKVERKQHALNGWLSQDTKENEIYYNATAPSFSGGTTSTGKR